MDDPVFPSFWLKVILTKKNKQNFCCTIVGKGAFKHSKPGTKGEVLFTHKVKLIYKSMPMCAFFFFW